MITVRNKKQQRSFYGWCAEANGVIRLGQDNFPIIWAIDEKEIAEDYINDGFSDEEKPRLIKYVLRPVKSREGRR